MVRVPWHRASSEAVASGALPCSSFLLNVSELVPSQPTARRRKAHPIRKVNTTAMRCPRRTTTHPPSLCLYSLLLASRSMPHNEPWRISTEAYSPKCVEGLFCELRPNGVLRSSALPWCYDTLGAMAHIHSPLKGVCCSRCVAI